MSQLRVSSVTDLSGTGSTYAPGHVVQVVQGVKSDVFSSGGIAGGASVTVTGLSASITPSSVSSKILVTVDVSGSSNLTQGFSIFLRRDGNAVGVGDAASNRSRVTSGGVNATSRNLSVASLTFLDSPASTSSLTYTVNILNTDDVTATLFINRTSIDADASHGARSASRITLMEIAQ
jgi:hypothetical protein